MHLCVHYSLVPRAREIIPNAARHIYVFTKNSRAQCRAPAKMKPRVQQHFPHAQSANKFCVNACDGGPRCTIGKVAGNVDHVWRECVSTLVMLEETAFSTPNETRIAFSARKKRRRVFSTSGFYPKKYSLWHLEATCFNYQCWLKIY